MLWSVCRHCVRWSRRPPPGRLRRLRRTGRAPSRVVLRSGGSQRLAGGLPALSAAASRWSPSSACRRSRASRCWPVALPAIFSPTALSCLRTAASVSDRGGMQSVLPHCRRHIRRSPESGGLPSCRGEAARDGYRLPMTDTEGAMTRMYPRSWQALDWDTLRSAPGDDARALSARTSG
jgi:hypothetical protein